MIVDIGYVRASDGTGEAVRGSVTAARAVGASTLQVDSLAKWPEKFIATVGTLNSENQLTPGTVTVFLGHIEDGKIVIDERAPGYADNGNTVGQVVMLKPASAWADMIAELLKDGKNPAGIISMFAGTTAPTGWLLCYGQAISRTTYAALYAAIGTTHGAGDGTTTFNVPDLRGRVVAGQDDMGGTSANRLTGTTGGVDGDVLGATGGSETHTLTTAQMPSHAHGSNWWRVDSEASGWGLVGSSSFGGRVAITADGGQSTTWAGDSQAHNNVQPTIVLNYIIKA